MPAKVEATPALPGLSPVCGKPVMARFDGGQLSSDAGVLARREIEQRLGVADRLAGSVGDPRVPERIVHSVADITTLAARLIEALSAPYELEGHQVVIGTSVGIALVPAYSEDPNHVLKCADLALYRAKSDGRGRYRYFEPGMDALMQARRVLEMDMRKALIAGEFEVYYQPLMTLQSRQICGFEALLRWSLSAARAGAAAGVHPPGGGYRADRADRRMGAAPGLCRCDELGREH